MVSGRVDSVSFLVCYRPLASMLGHNRLLQPRTLRVS